MAIEVTCNTGGSVQNLKKALQQFSGKAVVTFKSGKQQDFGHVTSFCARNLFQSPSPIEDFDALTSAGYRLNFITGNYYRPILARPARS
jgi:hypothetical protein